MHFCPSTRKMSLLEDRKKDRRQKKIMGTILGMTNIDYCHRPTDEIKH